MQVGRPASGMPRGRSQELREGVDGHCAADMVPSDSVRNRPHAAPASEIRARPSSRRALRLAAAAMAVLGAGMPMGVAGESVPGVQPVMPSPPYMAHAHGPSAILAADAQAPVLRKRDVVLGKAKSAEDLAMRQSTAQWPNLLGSPVSEPETPGLRAPLPALELRDIVKELASSAKNMKSMSTPQLELVSSEDEDVADVQGAVKDASAARGATRLNPPKLGLDIGWSSIPHPLKVQRGGEDSHIVARLHGATLLGVFDGVGGWAELGVDPAEYSRRLGRLVEASLAQNPSILETDDRPLMTLLTKAFEQLEEEELAGSCTASLALLTADGKLHVLNVGDSGVHVIRDGMCVFQTGEQQHYFNCPYQLGMGSDDRPTDAEYYVLEDLEPDDTIVCATDGVWDNLYETEMLNILKPVPSSDSSTSAPFSCPELLARAISEASHLHGKDERFLSPFAVNAANHGLSFSGGKLDDVTVVVCRVCDISPSAAPPPPAPASADAKKQAALSVERSLSSAAVGSRAGVGVGEARRSNGNQVDFSGFEYNSSPVSSAESSNE